VLAGREFAVCLLRLHSLRTGSAAAFRVPCEPQRTRPIQVRRQRFILRNAIDCSEYSRTGRRGR
jgi:hypothetical protein